MKDNLDAFIERSRSKILPATRRSGLASLPREILHLILKELLHMQGDPFCGARVIIRDLSLTSRAFRDVVIEASEVWAYLDLNKIGREPLDLCLHRSRGRPLSVRFKYSTKTEKSVLHALPSGDRWDYLSADFSSEELEHLEKPPAMSFTGVRTLRTNLSDFENSWQFPDWTFPNAEVVEMDDDVLQPHHIAHDSMKTFRYTSWNSDVGLDGRFLEKLTDFLRPAINLNVLILDVSFIRKFDAPEVFSEVLLPNVKKFAITSWREIPYEYWEEDNPLTVEDFTKIVKSLRLPNVEEISISIAFVENDFRVSDFLRKAFPTPLGSLTRLTFGTRHIPYRQTEQRLSIYIDDFFRLLPSLGLLDLDTENCNILLTQPAPGVRNLRSFRIKFNGTDRDQLYNMFERMHKRAKSLKEIRILSTYHLEEEKIRRMFRDAEIHIATY